MVRLKKTSFLDLYWCENTNIISHAFSLKRSDKDKLKNSHTAKLIALNPYLACCQYPKQQSLLKLSLFLADIFCGNNLELEKDQNIRNYISVATNLPDGDRNTIELVTDFLEYISINDHISDIKEDLKNKKYNPVYYHPEYYYRLSELTLKINSSDTKLVKQLRSIADPFIAGVWW